MKKNVLKYSLVAFGIISFIVGQILIFGLKKILLGIGLTVVFPIILTGAFIDLKKIREMVLIKLKMNEKLGTRVKTILLGAMFLGTGLIAELGIYLYKANLVVTGTVLFLLAFLGFVILAYKSANGTELMELFEYKQDKPFFLPAKLAVIVILAFLAQTFIHNNFWLIGVLTYVVALVQLLFVFRYAGKTQNALGVDNSKEKKIRAKVVTLSGLNDAGLRIRLLFAVLISVGLLFLSREWLANYRINAAFLVFVLAGAVLFYARKQATLLGKNTGFNIPVGFDYVLLAGIAVAGLYIRALNISNIPPGASLDEGLALYQANSIMRGELTGPFISNVQFQVASLYYYVLAMLGKIWPLSLELARLVSVVAGVLTIIFTYFLGRELYNRRTGLLAAALTTVSCVPLIYSRVAWLWIFVPLLAVAAFYFYLLGERKGKPIFFALSGLLLGLGLYYYNAAKMAPLVLAIYWGLLAIKKDTRPFILKNFRSLLVVVIMAFVVFLPLLQFIIMHPAAYLFRISTESAFTGHNKDWLTPAFLRQLISHGLDTFLMFTTKASRYGYFNYPFKPLLDPVSSFLALTGLAVIISGIRKKNNMFMLVWLTMAIAPALLAFHAEDPNTQRAILAIPAILLAAAAGFDTLLSYTEKVGKTAAVIIAPLVIIAAMIFVSYDNLNTYFKLYPNNRDVQSSFYNEPKVAADVALKNKNTKEYYSPYFMAMQNFGALIEINKSNFLTADISLLELNTLYNDKKMGVLIVGEGIYKDYVNIYKEYFPNAVITRKWNPLYEGSNPERHYVFKDKEEPALYYASVEIPYSDIQALYSIKASLRKKTGAVEEIKLQNAIVPSAGLESASLKVLLDIPYAGNYRLSCDGASADFVLDGRPVSGFVNLYKGLHRLTVNLSGFNKAEAYISWEIEGKGRTSPIPINYFINSQKIFGLLGEYTLAGNAISTQLDSTLCFRNYFFQSRVPGTFDVVWT